MPSDPQRSGGTGPDIARSALAAARAANRRKIAASPRRVAGRQARNPQGGYSGPGEDALDPARLGPLVRALIDDLGWTKTAAAAGVVARWAEMVGPGIAEHARPQSLLDGELVLVAESTAWATQLRLLAPRILARLSAEAGSGVVTRLRVHGPTVPSWRHGLRRVAGRGPRDTYG